MNGFSVSFFERLRSNWNRLSFQLRSRLRFRRSGYQEGPISDEDRLKWLKSLPEPAAAAARSLEERYSTHSWHAHLHLDNYRKNLATLWLLERLWDGGRAPREGEKLSVLEAGAHDFSRLFALDAFFRARGFSPVITGMELDPYRVLANFHSRADLADYYAGLRPPHRYLAGDFFGHREQYDLLLAFYPFVSPHPALAWGLPLEWGDPKRWVEGLIRTVKPEGRALLVHQGPWEEEEFDSALPYGAFRLKILGRKALECPFLPLPHPPQGSVYQLLLS